MGPGALALLGRALKTLLDETHFLWFVFGLGLGGLGGWILGADGVDCLVGDI